MEKKVLQLASVASMIDQFNMSNIEILQSLGYRVDVAADFTNPGTITKARAEELKKILDNMDVRVFDIPIPRSLNPKAIFTAYKQVKKLLDKEEYTLLHCHSPIGGVIAREAAKGKRKTGMRVIYTAHGFHFYDGAPIKNWMIYYPVEKYYARYTDVLITINREDYKRAKEKFHAKKVVRIPGVGVDTTKFAVCPITKEEKRKQLCIPKDAFMLLSVGELSSRKNQKVVIDALGRLQDSNIFYLVVGTGERKKEYIKLIKSYNLQNNIKLLGFRSDIGELCEAADCFVHPSVREGLGIAPLEAMAAGLPLISADVNGIKDYTKDGVSGYCIDPTSVDTMLQAIEKMKDSAEFRRKCAAHNRKIAREYDIHNTEKIMAEIYRGGLPRSIFSGQKESGIGSR